MFAGGGGGATNAPDHLRLQDLMGGKGEMHFRSRVNCFSCCRKVLSTERTSQGVSLGIRGAEYEAAIIRGWRER